MHLGFSFCGGGMIGGKRRSLLKQLWKQHQELNPSPTAASTNTPSSSHSRDRSLNAKAALKALSKRLKDRQLETLLQALDGSSSSPPLACVLVPRADVHLPGGARLAPHVVACQLWRWPTVEDARKLRVLPVCSTASFSSSSISSSSSGSSSVSFSSAQSGGGGGDAFLCCCNPFHWSTTIPDENPLSASLSDFGGEQIHKLSFDSDNDGDCRQWQTPWCHLVYREYKHHIGGFFSIYSDWTRVFQDLFHGDGMCLSLIQKPTTSRPVDRTRSKIGRGILLSRQNDSVWLFNCSEHPIFVCSPSFFVSGVTHGTGKFVVRRIPPGCSLKVYDCAVVDRLLSLTSGSADVMAESIVDGPVYLDSIHVSFVKGWGKQYTRQLITSCPCWMEILLRRK